MRSGSATSWSKFDHSFTPPPGAALSSSFFFSFPFFLFWKPSIAKQGRSFFFLPLSAGRPGRSSLWSGTSPTGRSRRGRPSPRATGSTPRRPTATSATRRTWSGGGGSRCWAPRRRGWCSRSRPTSSSSSRAPGRCSPSRRTSPPSDRRWGREVGGGGKEVEGVCVFSFFFFPFFLKKNGARQELRSDESQVVYRQDRRRSAEVFLE